MKDLTFISQTEHRPFSTPNHKWLFYQEWLDVHFLHWKVEEKELRTYLPEQLDIDTLNGQAWVSFVAFTMKDVKLRYLPKPGCAATFLELNLRTYVRYNGLPGVYFLNIEAGRKDSSVIAQSISGLPYRYAKMKRTSSKFKSQRFSTGDSFQLKAIKSELVQRTTTTDFLSERYKVFNTKGNSVVEFDVHHVEWLLYKLDVESLKIEYPRFENLLNDSPDLAYYSPGVPVVAWNKNVLN
jgi:uncharacterized protein YqjF (DUF2071 family)